MSGPPSFHARCFAQVRQHRHWLVWGLYAAVLVLAPLVFSSRLSLTILSQCGTMIILCLSYNLLLGQGGMLSFGHAVYSGLGSFVAMHAMNLAAGWAAGGGLQIPLPLIPLVGGLAGLFFAAVLGYPTTRKAGTPFAMITLGVGELVFAMALMFPGFFGGEGGITGNRVYGKPLWGLSFGPQRQVYYLIAAYCFVCTAALFAFTHTPLGRLLNAVRDNPERVEFIGYSTRQVRFMAFMVAGFFAGVAGGLGAINFEIVTAETVSSVRSGSILLFTFLGGVSVFFGPMLGAVLLVFSFVLLSELTQAWLLYVGLVFVLMVMAAPGGLAGLLLAQLRWGSAGWLRPWAAGYLALAGTGATVVLAVSLAVELAYHHRLDASSAAGVQFFGTEFSPSHADTWLGLLLTLLTGAGLFELVRRQFKAQGFADAVGEVNSTPSPLPKASS